MYKTYTIAFKKLKQTDQYISVNNILIIKHLTFSFSALSENLIISHCRKLDSLSYISVAESMGLISTTLTLVATKSTELGWVTQNNGHYAIQGN